MKQLTDTLPEAERVLAGIYRAMSPARKWQIIEQSRHLARMLHEAGVRQRNPSATPLDLHRSWLRATLGDFAERVRSWETGPMTSPQETWQVLQTIVSALDQMGIAYALGGSFASSFYGVPRNTLDADLAVVPFSGREAEFCQHFADDYYVSLPAVIEANRQRTTFNMISHETGFKIDLFVQKDRTFEHSLMSRRRMVSLGHPQEFPAAMVSPEDVILLKLEWYRLGGEISDRQWSDVLNVLRVQADQIDQDYLSRWAAQIGVLDLLDRIRSELS